MTTLTATSGAFAGASFGEMVGGDAAVARLWPLAEPLGQFVGRNIGRALGGAAGVAAIRCSSRSGKRSSSTATSVPLKSDEHLMMVKHGETHGVTTGGSRNIAHNEATPAPTLTLDLLRAALDANNSKLEDKFAHLFHITVQTMKESEEIR